MRRSDNKQGREWEERADYDERRKLREERHSVQKVREREGRRREERQWRHPHVDVRGASYRDIARSSASNEYKKARESRHAAQEVRERENRRGEERKIGRDREDRQWRGKEREDREWRGKERVDRDGRKGRGFREDGMSHSIEQFPPLLRPGNGRRGVPAPRSRV